MEISGIVKSESLYQLDLKHPSTEAPVGITMMIRSASSDAVKKVDRKHLDEITERQQRGKLVKGDVRLRHEIERTVAYIASWDWGENTYDGSTPELDPKTAAKILEAEGWIYVQVKEAAETVANFTEVAPKP